MSHNALMELIDSHCHINFPDLAEDIDAVLSNARLAGVTHMLCVSVNLEDYPQVQQLADTHEHIFSSVGVHPNETDGEDPSVERLVELASNERVVAVGETGLDYFRSDGELDWQRTRFANHIQAAKEVDKPLIIHTREATDDTVAIMKEQGATEPGGVMHCFTGDWDMATRCLDLGFYISFSGIVTFKSATDLQEVAKKVPADRMLIETDSPYLAPVPMRGKTNQPAFVKHVAEFVGELRGESAESVASQTAANFFDLFQHAKAA